MNQVVRKKGAHKKERKGNTGTKVNVSERADALVS